MILKDIKNTAIDNANFRKVLFTGQNSQIVVMSLDKGEDIGMEVHDNIDQIFVIVSGEAETVIDNTSSKANEGDIVIVPAGSMHNIINSGENKLKLYTIYAPPQHQEGTIHKTKKEAMDAEEEEHE